MSQRSPFEYDVSVSADKRRRTRRRGMSGAFESSERCCDWPGCEQAAQYRAPASPDRLTEFRWFCLEHVREYNAGWNYFAGRSEDEVEAYLNGANAWERPTWSLGKGPLGGKPTTTDTEGQAWARFGFTDPMEVLGENATISPGASAEVKRDGARPRRRLSRQEQHALDILGVPHQETERRVVRSRYRDLVKQLHPDMNGGENPDPDRLARVLKAWEVLRKSPHFSD
ncbi:MAG: J domain-containing protein [Pseudomonadota bacterium]